MAFSSWTLQSIPDFETGSDHRLASRFDDARTHKEELAPDFCSGYILTTQYNDVTVARLKELGPTYSFSALESSGLGNHTTLP